MCHQEVIGLSSPLCVTTQNACQARYTTHVRRIVAVAVVGTEDLLSVGAGGNALMMEYRHYSGCIITIRIQELV